MILDESMLLCGSTPAPFDHQIGFVRRGEESHLGGVQVFLFVSNDMVYLPLDNYRYDCRKDCVIIVIIINLRSAFAVLTSGSFDGAPPTE